MARADKAVNLKSTFLAGPELSQAVRICYRYVQRAQRTDNCCYQISIASCHLTIWQQDVVFEANPDIATEKCSCQSAFGLLGPNAQIIHGQFNSKFRNGNKSEGDETIPAVYRPST